MHGQLRRDNFKCTRYINVFLWLPVANIFGSIIGKIQEQMLKLDISQIQEQGDTFFSRTDAGYLIFMIIGIVGYFTVPSVANCIVHAGAGGALGHKVNTIMSASSHTAMSAGASVVQRAGTGLGNIIQTPGYISEGYHAKDKGGYQQDKLKGKSP